MVCPVTCLAVRTFRPQSLWHLKRVVVPSGRVEKPVCIVTKLVYGAFIPIADQMGFILCLMGKC